MHEEGQRLIPVILLVGGLVRLVNMVWLYGCCLQIYISTGHSKHAVCYVTVIYLAITVFLVMIDYLYRLLLFFHSSLLFVNYSCYITVIHLATAACLKVVMGLAGLGLLLHRHRHHLIHQ